MWNFTSKKVNQVPSWINELSDTASQNALLSMVSRGAKLEKPREMIFTMYATYSNAQKIQKEADAAGWHCSLRKLGSNELIDPNSPLMNISIDIAREGYILSQKNFERHSLLFDKLAKKYNSVCDGWYASTEPNE